MFTAAGHADVSSYASSDKSHPPQCGTAAPTRPPNNKPRHTCTHTQRYVYTLIASIYKLYTYIRRAFVVVKVGGALVVPRRGDDSQFHETLNPKLFRSESKWPLRGSLGNLGGTAAISIRQTEFYHCALMVGLQKIVP